MSGARTGLLLALLAACLYLPGIGRTDLWAPDEPNFAEVSREMVVDGEWALPHDNGEVFTDKPPLFFWLIALVSLVAGAVSSWTARFPSAVAGIAAVLLTWRIGRRLLGERAGVAGAAAFAVSWLAFDKGRSAQIDMLLCALILAALACFLRVRAGAGRGWALGLWLAMALAILAKGPVGLILPLGTIALFLALSGELRLARRLAPVAGPLLLLLVVGAWMAAAQMSGWDEGYSIADALKRHVFLRFAEGMHHPKPPYYYFQALPRGILPWAGFLPGMIAAGLGGLRRPRRAGPLFLLCWFGFVFLFFSVSTEKRDLYVLPLYPAAGLLLALLAEAALPGSKSGGGASGIEAPGLAPEPLSRLWVLVPAWATALLFAAAGAFALGLSESGARRLSPQTLAPLLDEWTGVYGPVRWAVAVLLPGGVAVAVLLWRRRGGAALVAIGAGAGACWLAVALLVLPAFNPHNSSREFCGRIEAVAGPTLRAGERVGIYRFYRSTFTFYTPRVRYQTLEGKQETLSFLSAPPPRFLLALSEDEAAIPLPSGIALDVVERGRVGHRKYLLLKSHSGQAPAPEAGEQGAGEPGV